MPEETKPVEREVNPDEQRRRDEEWDRAAALADYNAGWDAALERAAALLEEEVDEEGGYPNGVLSLVRSLAEQIRALKGSR